MMRMIILTLIMVVVAVAVTVVDAVAAGAAWHVAMVGARGSFGRR